MAISKINYYGLGDTTPNTIAVMEGLELGDFCEDILGIADTRKVKVLLNGSIESDMEIELQDGDIVKVEALKTDSGQ